MKLIYILSNQRPERRVIVFLVKRLLDELKQNNPKNLISILSCNCDPLCGKSGYISVNLEERQISKIVVFGLKMAICLQKFI